MEQLSYYFSGGAFWMVFACWIILFASFALRKKPEKLDNSVTAPRSWLGFGLQGLSYAEVWSIHRSPMFSPFVADSVANIILQTFAVCLAIASLILVIKAIKELGKQWSLQARLLEGHTLIMTGPYNLVRHPIYTAMLGKLIATGIVFSPWWVLLIAIPIFVAGTLIRIRNEEGLLASAFGVEFENWKKKVPALIPFVI